MNDDNHADGHPLDRTLGHRAPLLWLALPVMGGLAAVGAGASAPVAATLVISLALSAAALALERPAPSLAALAGSMLLAGVASGVSHRGTAASGGERPPRAIHLSLRIRRVFPQGSPLKAGGIALIADARGLPSGLAGRRIYYSARLRPGQPPPERTAKVAASGLLVAVPRGRPASTFYGSLAGQGVGFMLVRARILRDEEPAGAYYRFCNRLARRMDALLGEGLGSHPELAAMYRAMMLGRKGDLQPGQKLLFIHSGAMHLFAINGVHIGMVAAALHAMLALLRCPRAPASLAVLAVLWLDVDTTGGSPSAVRAFVMVAILEAAFAMRRPCNPVAALAGSALLSVLIDPMDFFSASFQMSYAVVCAILTLGLPLAGRLERRFPPFPDIPEASWSPLQRASALARRHLLQAAGIGLAAGLVGAITGIQFFGLFAPVGVVLNILLVPLASLAIVGGCLSLAIPHWGFSASPIFNRAAAVVLLGIQAIMNAGSRMPGAWMAARFRAGWIGPAALATLVAALIAGYASGWSRARGGWLPPFLVVAAALAFGVKYG